MGKPPFKYRPNKPMSAAASATRRAGQIETTGSEDVMALYADVFVVANEAGTKMASLYFYQRVLPDRAAVLGKTDTDITIAKAKCVARIVLAPEGIDKFLHALAENRGFDVTPKSPTPEPEEENK